MISASITWALAFSLFAATPADPKKLYREAETLYNNGQYTAADKKFTQTYNALGAFKKQLEVQLSKQGQSKEKSQQWQLLRYGQANAMLFRSYIDKKNNKPYTSCKKFNEVIQTLRSLPTGWQQWNVPDDAKKRLIASEAVFVKQCDNLLSKVALTVTPPNATIEQFVGKKWSLVPASSVQNGKVVLEVPKDTPTFLVRITAKGYKEKTHTIKVERWSQQSASVSLEKKQVVVAVKRRTPLPPPKPKPGISPWVWVGVGVVGAAAIGGGIAAIVYFTQPYTERLVNCEGQPGFNLWGTTNCP